jgi:hypothetical protein
LLGETAVNDSIRDGASIREVRELTGHSGIRTAELCFVREEEDAEFAARRIQVRRTGRQGL